MAGPIKRITAEPAVVAELERRSRATSVEVLVKERASIVRLRLEGQGVAAVAARLGTTAERVSTWTKRFESKGLAGLEDAPGRGRKPSIAPERIERVLTEATRPPVPRQRWSLRSMSRHAGVSPATVQRIWSKNALKPHVTRTSNSPTIRGSRRSSGT